MATFTAGYNERLFKSGLRAKYHLARYHWLARELGKLGIVNPRVIELGCFDAKTIDFLPSKPGFYLGLDADWEGGLSQGMARWEGHNNIELLKCLSPDDIPDRGKFDVGISLETLEHLNDDILEAYLAKLSEIISGKLFISVPHEKGLVFLAKYLAKDLFFDKDGASYSWRDIALLTLGKSESVERNQHKGFNENALLRLLSKYWNVDKVTSVFPNHAPLWLSLTIGIQCSSRRRG